MTRRRLGHNAMAALAEMHAEDTAIRLLATLPPRVAAITAVKAAVELLSFWESEKREILRRDDDRPVCLHTAGERHWLYSAAAQYCVDPCWQNCPASEVRDELAGLPPDAAAFVAYKAAQWACRQEPITSTT
jgi:hypothetical protein